MTIITLNPHELIFIIMMGVGMGIAFGDFIPKFVGSVYSWLVDVYHHYSLKRRVAWHGSMLRARSQYEAEERERRALANAAYIKTLPIVRS